MQRGVANLIGFVLTWALWIWLAMQDMSTVVMVGISVGGALLVIPLVLVGRWLLDRQPDIGRAEWVTLVVHYLLAMLLGSAVITATRFGMEASAWLIPLPPWLGILVMLLSSLVLIIAVINLIFKGLGMPFAIALTRQVVTDWLYAWTRNPMVLSALAFLIGLGLWLGSALFLVWVLAVVSPAILVFLRVFEERELEIRFGEAYLKYKASTPMLFPRKSTRKDRR